MGEIVAPVRWVHTGRGRFAHLAPVPDDLDRMSRHEGYTVRHVAALCLFVPGLGAGWYLGSGYKQRCERCQEKGGQDAPRL